MSVIEPSAPGDSVTVPHHRLIAYDRLKHRLSEAGSGLLHRQLQDVVDALDIQTWECRMTANDIVRERDVRVRDMLEKNLRRQLMCEVADKVPGLVTFSSRPLDEGYRDAVVLSAYVGIPMGLYANAPGPIKVHQV